MHFNLLKNKQKSQENIVLKSQKSYKKAREKSRGRSMVEMLGVLAIIGVLSIGGIQGYTLAMRRYRANEIVNTLLKFAAINYTAFENKKLNDETYNELCDSDHCPNANDLIFYKKDVEINFANSGIGTLPTGIKDIRSSSIFITEDDKEGVMLEIQFDSDEDDLCETLLSMLNGVAIDFSDGADDCRSYIYKGFLID